MIREHDRAVLTAAVPAEGLEAYLAYFFLFGTVGGWCFAFAMSPSGITAVSILALVSAALCATLVSSLILQFRKKRSRAESVAMIAGYLYPVCLGIVFGIGFVFVH